METKSYRGGAPEKPDSEKRERFVQVRFRADEYRLLKERKQKTMARDMSSFIRSVCLEKPLLLKSQVATYQTIALSLLREMRSDVLHIGVTINQSVRRANLTTNTHDLQQSMDETSRKLSQLEMRLCELTHSILGVEHQSTNAEHDCPDQ